MPHALLVLGTLWGSTSQNNTYFARKSSGHYLPGGGKSIRSTLLEGDSVVGGYSEDSWDDDMTFRDHTYQVPPNDPRQILQTKLSPIHADISLSPYAPNGPTNPSIKPCFCGSSFQCDLDKYSTCRYFGPFAYTISQIRVNSDSP